MTEENSEKLLTVDNVCEEWQVTRDWVYDQVQSRRLPHLRIGRGLRFRRHELEAFLAERYIGKQ